MMNTCEWCNELFDVDVAEDEFETETFLLNYNNIKKCLCGKCSISAIEDEVDGVYFEKCERCGSEFDLIEDNGEFERRVDGIDLKDMWDSTGDIICFACAMEEYLNE